MDLVYLRNKIRGNIWHEENGFWKPEQRTWQRKRRENEFFGTDEGNEKSAIKKWIKQEIFRRPKYFWLNEMYIFVFETNGRIRERKKERKEIVTNGTNWYYFLLQEWKHPNYCRERERRTGEIWRKKSVLLKLLLHYMTSSPSTLPSLSLQLTWNGEKENHNQFFPPIFVRSNNPL